MPKPQIADDDAIVERLRLELGRTGQYPSVRQLADLLGYQSPAAMHRRLLRLVAAGRLTYRGRSWRPFALPGHPPE